MSPPEWNQNEYASITGPLLLKSTKEGNVKLSIAAQTMLTNKYSRGLVFRVTH